MLILVMTLMVSLAGNAQYNEIIDDIGYSLDISKKEASVTQRNYSGSIVIPATITYNGETYSVTSIGQSAFSSCNGVTSIKIPNSVTSIGRNAFIGCGITSITIPNSVTFLGEFAFADCLNLTSIKISNSITSIARGVFSGCSNLTSIEIPDGVTDIGPCAFFNCKGLTSINIPNSVVSIGESSFESCIGLTSVTIGNSVESIGNYAFQTCESLPSVTIPNSVTFLGECAFNCCFALTSITISNPLMEIHISNFNGCDINSFTNLSKIPQSIHDCGFVYHPNSYTILHVLPGCKETYQNAEFWKEFTIVEDAVDPFAKIELADGKTYNEETEQSNKEIIYTRTFNNTQWQSLYIPFSMSYEDWKDDFDVAYINGVRQLDRDDDGVIDETTMDVIKIKNGSFIPNTPYLIRAKSTGEKTITVNDATLYKSEENSIECSTMLARYTFTGTYNTIPAATLLENNYYAMGGGSLVMTNGTSDLKPFRWYLKIDSRSPMYNVNSAAKSIIINMLDEEEEATGIAEFTNTQHLSPINQMYDLNGRKVARSSLKPGLYIKNGKKIVIK